MRHLRNFVDSKFTHSVFASSVIGHIFACVCEVQLRLCVNNCFEKDVRSTQKKSTKREKKFGKVFFFNFVEKFICLSQKFFQI